MQTIEKFNTLSRRVLGARGKNIVYRAPAPSAARTLHTRLIAAPSVSRPRS